MSYRVNFDWTLGGDLMKQVVILTANGFRDEEVIYPFYRLHEIDNARVVIAADTLDEKTGKFGIRIGVDVTFAEISSHEFDAVILPGGFSAPERLRCSEAVLGFVRNMNEERKAVAAICHGVWILISAGIVMGKELTCYPGMADDLRNAGATFVDKPVVTDGNLITSRRPSDLPFFMKELTSRLFG